MENRIFLYPKDLMILTGKKATAAWRYYNQLRDCLGKKPGKKITITEYCKEEGVLEADVKKALKIS